MQPIPAHYVQRLRELGLVPPSETIAHINHGDWRQHGQFYVARMTVGVVNGDRQRERAYWLKCPHDYWYDLDDVIKRKVRIGNILRAAGGNIPVTEWFEPATMIQEEVEGRIACGGSRMPDWARDPIRKELELYRRAGFNYMDGVGGNFIIDWQNRAWCIDLDFNEVRKPAEESGSTSAWS